MTSHLTFDSVHSVDPYQGFDPSKYPLDLQGWNSERPVFEQLIDLLRPETIIEVGTWKGASAIHMAKLLNQKNIDGKVLCVDTWLGSEDLWENARGQSMLRLKFGFPQIYRQFLANVLKSGVSDKIIPFPQTSQNAFRWIKSRNITADLIYIDGSHDAADVYHDLSSYYEIVKPGGIVFGDDYTGESPGVASAVNRFTQEKNENLKIAENQFWIIQKSKAAL